MKRRCKSCNGTGKEDCEVHGSHICSQCGGSGCTNSPFNLPHWGGTYRSMPMRSGWKVTDFPNGYIDCQIRIEEP